MNFLTSLGMKNEHLHFYDQKKEELAHYSKATTDIEYLYPFGFDELWGIANRTDHDLKNHMEGSGEDFKCVDPETNEKFIPYCIEPALGLDRVILAFLCEAYDEEVLESGDSREVMRFHPALAPYKVAVLPLNKKYHGEKAREDYSTLASHFVTSYDETASIGKRYRRCDAIGTPFAVTVDDDTLNNGTVTLRDRDTMEQIVLPLEEVVNYVEERIKF